MSDWVSSQSLVLQAKISTIINLKNSRYEKIYCDDYDAVAI